MITTTRTLTVYALGAYQEPLRSLVMAKQWGNRAVTTKLGEMLRTSGAAYIPCDVVVPIPLHWVRQAQRGYNQAEVLASEFVRGSSALAATLLLKTYATPAQAGYGAGPRSTNVRGSFAMATESLPLYANKHVVIVDDVMTTGATLREAARVLLPLRPASLSAVVACRVC